MTEPRTEAGWKAVRWFAEVGRFSPKGRHAQHMRSWVGLIEDEARQMGYEMGQRDALAAPKEPRYEVGPLGNVVERAAPKEPREDAVRYDHEVERDEHGVSCCAEHAAEAAGVRDPEPRCETCGLPDRGHDDSHGFHPAGVRLLATLDEALDAERARLREALRGKLLQMANVAAEQRPMSDIARGYERACDEVLEYLAALLDPAASHDQEDPE